MSFHIDRKVPGYSFLLIQHTRTDKMLGLPQVVFKLNYIPHETLRALLGVLKQSWAGTLAGGVVGIEFGVVALKSFHR